MRPKLLSLVDTKAIQKFRASRGFTLIELLVVITIIAILAGVAFPVVNGVMARARKLKTLAVAKDLQVAIKSYQTEYNRLPGEPGADATINTTDTAFVAILIGEPGTGTYTNPREIKFADFPIAKGKKGGLDGVIGSQSLMDDWGYPYTVILDSNYDNRITNPDTSNSDPGISSGAAPELPISIAVYSNGADKQASTKDDVTSWRG